MRAAEVPDVEPGRAAAARGRSPRRRRRRRCSRGPDEPSPKIGSGALPRASLANAWIARSGRWRGPNTVKNRRHAHLEAEQVVVGVREELAPALGRRVRRDRPVDRIVLRERDLRVVPVHRRRRAEEDVGTSCRRHASRTATVPSRLTEAYSAGSAIDGRTPARAARWTTASTGGSAARAASSGGGPGCPPRRDGSRRGPSPPRGSRASPPPGRTGRSCRGRRPRDPSASSRSTRCEPMNPAPPVTRIVLTSV